MIKQNEDEEEEKTEIEIEIEIDFSCTEIEDFRMMLIILGPRRPEPALHPGDHPRPPWRPAGQTPAVDLSALYQFRRTNYNVGAQNTM